MIEDPVSRGHCQRDAVTQVQLRRADATYIATCCTARLWVENFVGGKFRDLSMSHENNENWHPTKITRYTVFSLSLCYCKGFIYNTCQAARSLCQLPPGGHCHLRDYHLCSCCDTQTRHVHYRYGGSLHANVHWFNVTVVTPTKNHFHCV